VALTALAGQTPFGHSLFEFRVQFGTLAREPAPLEALELFLDGLGDCPAAVWKNMVRNETIEALQGVLVERNGNLFPCDTFREYYFDINRAPRPLARARRTRS
jgi:hypothetical protein